MKRSFRFMSLLHAVALLEPIHAFVSAWSIPSHDLQFARKNFRNVQMAESSLLEEDDVSPNPYQLRTARTACIKGVSPRDGPLNEAVAHVTGISLEEANALIGIGAVWARMETLTEQDILDLYDEEGDAASSSRAIYADLGAVNLNTEDIDIEEYINQMESLRFRRILSPSWVEAGTDLRVYPNPRRFPVAKDLTRDRLLYEDTTFLVVDKPPMLPTQPDASNYYENCPGALQENLGPFHDILGREVPRPLLCHRVDACVGGCVVLSKDRNGQKVFHQLQRERKLRKVYLAVTTKPVPVGLHVHWMYASQTARGSSGGPPCQLVSHQAPESRRKARQYWNRCVLEVMKCEAILVSKDNIYGYDPGTAQHYESTIRLVTGRKHQVRAQLASLGAPIIRDTLYEPMAGLTLENLEVSEEDMDAAVARCRAPTEPIGLQAHAILFAGVKAKAGRPWWRVDEE